MFCQEALLKPAGCGWHIAKYYPDRSFSDFSDCIRKSVKSYVTPFSGGNGE